MFPVYLRRSSANGVRLTTPVQGEMLNRDHVSFAAKRPSAAVTKALITIGGVFQCGNCLLIITSAEDGSAGYKDIRPRLGDAGDVF